MFSKLYKYAEENSFTASLAQGRTSCTDTPHHGVTLNVRNISYLSRAIKEGQSTKRKNAELVKVLPSFSAMTAGVVVPHYHYYRVSQCRSSLSRCHWEKRSTWLVASFSTDSATARDACTLGPTNSDTVGYFYTLHFMDAPPITIDQVGLLQRQPPEVN